MIAAIANTRLFGGASPSPGLTVEYATEFQGNIRRLMAQDNIQVATLCNTVTGLSTRRWTPTHAEYDVMMRVMEFQSNDFMCKVECVNRACSDEPALPARFRGAQLCDKIA